MSRYDHYCREAAAALEAARYVSFLPDKDALIAKAQHLLQQATSARSPSWVAPAGGSYGSATLGPLFNFGVSGASL